MKTIQEFQEQIKIIENKVNAHINNIESFIMMKRGWNKLNPYALDEESRKTLFNYLDNIRPALHEFDCGKMSSIIYANRELDKISPLVDEMVEICYSYPITSKEWRSWFEVMDEANKVKTILRKKITKLSKSNA